MNRVSLLLYAVSAARCWNALALEYDDEIGNSEKNKNVVVLQPRISTSAKVTRNSLIESLGVA